MRFLVDLVVKQSLLRSKLLLLSCYSLGAVMSPPMCYLVSVKLLGNREDLDARHGLVQDMALIKAHTD